MLQGKHMTFCRVSNETLSLSAEIIRYPNFTTLVKPASHCPYQHRRHMGMPQDAVAAGAAATAIRVALLAVTVCVQICS